MTIKEKIKSFNCSHHQFKLKCKKVSMLTFSELSPERQGERILPLLNTLSETMSWNSFFFYFKRFPSVKFPGSAFAKVTRSYFIFSFTCQNIYSQIWVKWADCSAYLPRERFCFDIPVHDIHEHHGCFSVVSGVSAWLWVLEVSSPEKLCIIVHIQLLQYLAVVTAFCLSGALFSLIYVYVCSVVSSPMFWIPKLISGKGKRARTVCSLYWKLEI